MNIPRQAFTNHLLRAFPHLNDHGFGEQGGDYHGIVVTDGKDAMVWSNPERGLLLNRADMDWAGPSPAPLTQVDDLNTEMKPFQSQERRYASLADVMRFGEKTGAVTEVGQFEAGLARLSDKPIWDEDPSLLLAPPFNTWQSGIMVTYSSTGPEVATFSGKRLGWEGIGRANQRLEETEGIRFTSSSMGACYGAEPSEQFLAHEGPKVFDVDSVDRPFSIFETRTFEALTARALEDPNLTVHGFARLQAGMEREAKLLQG